jgi:peptidylprolyl isomerase
VKRVRAGFRRMPALRTRGPIACGVAALALLFAGCTEEESGLGKGSKEAEKNKAVTSGEGGAKGGAARTARPKPKPKVAVPSGPPPKKLAVKDLAPGQGAEAESGSQLTVNYVGVRYKDGKEFDSSFKAGQPFQFRLGAGSVIPGWDRGLVGMKVGGRRRLTIPSSLAYGPTGSPPAIGPNETLVFVVDLLGVR